MSCTLLTTMSPPLSRILFMSEVMKLIKGGVRHQRWEHQTHSLHSASVLGNGASRLLILQQASSPGNLSQNISDHWVGSAILFWIFFFFTSQFLTGFHCRLHAGFELRVICLFQPPKFRNYWGGLALVNTYFKHIRLFPWFSPRNHSGGHT